jgi:O-antigen biosynthesis protein
VSTGDELQVARERAAVRGRLRGAIAEARTQLARAEQDVALPWSYWASTWTRRSPRPGSVTTGPLVSVITPVYAPRPADLRACLASVAAQTYRNWRHVLVDDASPGADTLTILRDAAWEDRRRVVLALDENQGIVGASNVALDEVAGEYVVMLDHDDVLAPRALERLAAALGAAPSASFAYSDNDLLRADGRLTSPFLKPDFSPERLRHQNYVLHCVMARADAMRQVGGFRPGFDGAQDHDLVLRLSEVGDVVHVPEVLYHWREAPASVAANADAKPYAYDAGVRAVQSHCDRVGIDAVAERGAYDGVYRLLRRVPDATVSVIVPTRGTRREVWGRERTLVVEAVRSIVERSPYTRVEFVVVADTATPPAVRRELATLPGVRIVEFDDPFNFSAKCNLGAAQATGELLLFLNDDTELIEPGSIAEMASLAAEDGVGLVGAKLLFEDGTMQHAGHVYPGLCTHALIGYPGDHPGPYRMASVVRECSGVTAAAAMIRADRFAEVGRFDAALPHNFNDVDLSLRLRRAGYRNLWTPFASWYHLESATRDPATGDAERALVLSRWRAEIERDPYHHPDLAPHRSDWLERPGRSGAPPYYRDARGRRRFI